MLNKIKPFSIVHKLSKRRNRIHSGSIVITGAAQGFGRAIAETFGRNGWEVGAFDVDVATLKEWAEDHRNVTAGHLDVRNPEDWQQQLADFAGTRGGQINVLVNNAGVLYAGDFADSGSFDEDSRLVDINIKGVLFGARTALPYLQKAAEAGKGAHLINLCSASAIYGTPDMATYSATKYAVRGITEALEVEWEDRGVQVSSIIPLYSNTSMIASERTVGMERLGVRTTPQDVADVVHKVVANGRSVPAKVHHAEGLQPAVLFQSSFFSPPFLTRFINSKLVYDKPVKF